MEKELGPEVIKATQLSLGKYVKRPPLTEKLLKKPPFRFLHDVVTSVLKTNGFFEGLFDDEELISDNVKDRDSKILFLNKVISIVAFTTGKSLSVKPSKIVAGQEPEKTNELLQSLAYALDKKLSSDEAVKKYKEKAKTSQSTDVNKKEKESKPTKKNESTKLTSKSSEKLTSNKKEFTATHKNEKAKISDPKSKRKDTVPSKNEQHTKKSQNLKTVGKKASVESLVQSSLSDTSNQKQQSQNVNVSLINQNEEIITNNEVHNKETNEVQEDFTETEPATNIESNTHKADHTIQDALNSSYTIADNELNSSSSSQNPTDPGQNEIDNIEAVETVEKLNLASKAVISIDVLQEKSKENFAAKEESDENASLRKPRPVTIPKHSSLDSEVKAKEFVRHHSHDNATPPNKLSSDIVRPMSVRPPSSRPGAPRLREKVDNIVPENDHLLLGKVNIITETAQNEEEEDTSVIIVEQHGIESEVRVEDQQETLQLSTNGHGHLVQQILNSQKDLAHVAGKTEIEWQYGGHKTKEASSQEIEQLQYNIQAISRVANPLGKLLDHIQEDVEVMRQELQQWTNVYEDVSKDMTKQKAESEETLIPLKSRINQLDMDIEEKRDKISDIKILIHKNTARIDKLLASGHVQ